MEDAPTHGTTSISPSTDSSGANAGVRAQGRTQKRAIRGFFVVLLMFLGFAVFFAVNFRTVVVSGQSMEPTFKSGQRVLVSHAWWLIGPVRHKDIVVLREADGKGYYIKRVYRLAGESVDWANAPEKHRLSDGPYVVPEGTVYVLGDNRSHSEDSRKIGAVPVERILGKVVVRP